MNKTRRRIAKRRYRQRRRWAMYADALRSGYPVNEQWRHMLEDADEADVHSWLGMLNAQAPLTGS